VLGRHQVIPFRPLAHATEETNMRKGRREFFEVFRRVPEQKEPTTWWRKNARSGPAIPPAGTTASSAKLVSVRETVAPSNKVVLTLSRELLVVISVATFLALVGAFVCGHSLGRSSAARAAVALNASLDAAKMPLSIPASNALASNAAAPSAPSSPYYTLRLKISSIDRQNAERIAADLCAMGYDAFALPASASSWSVNIGRFASYQSKEAEAYKKKVSPVTYKNQRFACSWEKVIN
jgi:hypothetical protein